MSGPKNIIDKIWDAHLVKQVEGHPAIMAIDFMLIHEVTSAQAFETLRNKGISVADAGMLLATLDHSIPTRSDRLAIHDDAARIQVETLRGNTREFGVPLVDFDGGQGIVHVIGPEVGLTQPGMTIVCGDSHTSTHGAFGALAFGIGTSQVGHVMATGCLLQQKPKSMRVEFNGSLPNGVYAKDVILKLISEIGIGGATGHVIEYTGEAIRAMRMDERMTICNMSIECGARAGLIAPDQTTFDYVKGKKYAPRNEDWERAVAYWSGFVSDEGSTFDKEIVIDISSLKPMITWGTNPGQSVEVSGKTPALKNLSPGERISAEKALRYVDLSEDQLIEGLEIDWAFVGSCTNGRIEDLREAATILKGKKISDRVTFFVVPGSELVRNQAIEEGLDKIFTDAGVDFRMPGCSLCLAMNDDQVPAGKRCISSSNRNFVGRQGEGSRTHLASPATVAASALEGRITPSTKFLSE